MSSKGRRAPPSLTFLKNGKNCSSRPTRKAALPKNAPEIGIPRILYFHETFPFWRAFFTELGWRVVLSDATHKELIRKGVENVVGETCFPIKVSHGTSVEPA